MTPIFSRNDSLSPGRHASEFGHGYLVITSHRLSASCQGDIILCQIPWVASLPALYPVP